MPCFAVDTLNLGDEELLKSSTNVKTQEFLNQFLLTIQAIFP